jgi:methyltransferase
MIWYFGLIALVGVERLAELVVAKRNAKWSFARGGIETGRGHYPAMVALHTAFLISCILETIVFDRPFIPLLGWTMFVLFLAAQALRWWCIVTLGHQWNTRVIVVPGMQRITSGPYRWMSHPNYVAVVVEGIALPLIHTNYITAIAFTTINAFILWLRIRSEREALHMLEVRE